MAVGLSLRRLNRKLDHVVARGDKEFILVVKGHSERHAFQIQERQVASVRVEDLNAFHVADVNTSVSVHGDRVRCTELSGLITIAAEAIHKLPVAPKIEDPIIESAERVYIARAVNRDSRV